MSVLMLCKREEIKFIINEVLIDPCIVGKHGITFIMKDKTR